MTQKRGLGRGLGALIPGAGSTSAPEQELRTRTRPADETAGGSGAPRPVDMFFSGERLDSEGCTRFVVTDVSKDGTLAGPNVALLRDVAAATDAKIVASGGISVLDDVVELSRHADEGIDSAIIGKALYEGRFTLREALAAVEKQ